MTKTLVSVAALLLSSFAAHADTVSYQFGLAPVLATTEINQSGNLSLFDPSMGTLTGAMLEVRGDAIFTFQATNNAVQSQNARLIASTELSWTSSLGTLGAFLGDTISLSGDSGVQSYAVGETKAFGPFAGSQILTDDLVTILASLQGFGLFSIGCESSSGFQVLGGGGNLLTSQKTEAGCGAKITYTFEPASTPVPEPTSLALAGLALAAAGLSARRRKA